MSETPRCEPADPTKDGWHYVQRGSDHPRSVEWVHSWGWVGLGANREPTIAARAGYRYLMAIPTPAEIAALVAAARAVYDHLEYEANQGGGDFGDVVGPLAEALDEALVPFAKDTPHA